MLSVSLVADPFGDYDLGYLRRCFPDVVAPFKELVIVDLDGFPFDNVTHHHRGLALMQTLCLFALSPTGFRHRDVRADVAQLLGRDPEAYAAGQMTYDLRRLRLHGVIERVPDTHRYRVTALGARMAMLYVRLYARALRPMASLQPTGSPRGQQAFERLDAALAHFLEEVKLAA